MPRSSLRLIPIGCAALTLTNCDAHDNWPPDAFKPFVEMVAAGKLPGTLAAMLGDKSIYRSPGALGPGYERPETVTDEDIEVYLRPHVRNEQRTRDWSASSLRSITNTRLRSNHSCGNYKLQRSSFGVRTMFISP